MRLFSTQHLFNYPWNHVTHANWNKYPNPNSPQVIHVDVLDRRVDPETGILHTERLIACKQPIPTWISKMIGTDNVAYFLEKSTVDPQTQTYTATSKNLTLSQLLNLEEKIIYKADANSTDRTFFQQEAAVSASGLNSFRTYIEDYCVNRFHTNAEKVYLMGYRAVKAWKKSFDGFGPNPNLMSPPSNMMLQ